MSNESKIYDGWTDDPHAMTTRASWYDEEQSVWTKSHFTPCLLRREYRKTKSM